MSIYIDRRGYQKDLLPEFRNFKLKLIQSEIEFSVSKDSIKKFQTELSFIRKEFASDIITGSLALSLFGLINRDINDIDILINDEKRYPKYNNNTYGDDERGVMDNRLGFIRFKYKSGFFSKTRDYEVDFFKNEDSSYIEIDFEGTSLKIQHPAEIISAKIKMARNHKHYRDLENIFQKFDI